MSELKGFAAPELMLAPFAMMIAEAVAQEHVGIRVDIGSHPARIGNLQIEDVHISHKVTYPGCSTYGGEALNSASQL